MPYTLVNNVVCPFAHRAWLTAEFLAPHCPYERKETAITAGQKPAWFTELYQRALGANEGSDGKVPVLQDGDFVLCESAVVAEYIATKYGAAAGLKLMPELPEQRARYQIFLEQAIGPFVKAFYTLLMAQGDEAVAKAAEEMRTAAARVSTFYTASQKAAGNSGPFFFGPEPTLADICLYPWISRQSVLTHYRGFSVPAEERFAAYHAFTAAFAELPQAKATAQPAEVFVEAYAAYANPKK